MTKNFDDFAEDRYLLAKAYLEEMLNGEDAYAKTFNAFAAISGGEIYTCQLQQIGKNIIAHIEALKTSLDGNTLTIDDLTAALDTLRSYIFNNREASSIDELLNQLKSKIATEEYNKLAAKICFFVGLSLILASLSLLAFCVATNCVSLIPLGVIGLSCMGPIFIAFSFAIDGDNLEDTVEKKGFRSYFFNSTTLQSEIDRKNLSIFESHELEEGAQKGLAKP